MPVKIGHSLSISYRGHDVVIFVDRINTEITIESLGIEIILDSTCYAAAIKSARAQVDSAVGPVYRRAA